VLSCKVPVLVGKFSDSGSDQWTTSNLEKELFKGPWSSGTLSEYYREVSYNQFNLDGSVYGWYTAKQNENYYGNSVYGLPDLGGRTPEYVRELIAAADASVDFSQFDNDGDGKVEAVFIIHYGQGAEQYTNPSSFPNEIWSHQAKLSDYSKQGGAYKTNDKTSTNKDVYVDSYIIVPAVKDDGKTMIEIGIFCHEYGHALGLPDLYDCDNSSEGIGHWGLMGSGNWNKPDCPAHMSAWEKIKMGWLTPIKVTHNETGVNILNAEQNDAVYKLWTYGSYSGSQYFLVENRQAKGFDKNLHGPGILIWHVDDGVKNNDTESHKMVDLEEADGANDLDAASNRGDGGDCYPGSANNTTYNSSSSPNSRDYSSNDSHCAVQNISISASTMTADLIVGTADLPTQFVIKDCPTDDGDEPSPCNPWWTESDIWIDNNSDGKADIPAQGMNNLLWTRVYNFGKDDAVNAKVSFYYSTPAMGLLYPSKAIFIEDTTIALITKNKGSEKVPVKWYVPRKAATMDHYCIGVIAQNDKDKPSLEKPHYDNNLAQINYIYLVKNASKRAVDAIASQNAALFEHRFLVCNSREQPWRYQVKMIIIDMPRGWTAAIDLDIVNLGAGDCQEGLLTVTASRPQHGDSAHVRLVMEDMEYHTIEGGIDFVCAVDNVPPLAPDGALAASYFLHGNYLTPPMPTVQLSWGVKPEDEQRGTERIVYHKIYRWTDGSAVTVLDSTAIDVEPDQAGFQWYDTVDVSTGPFYYAVSSVDPADNESALSDASPVRVPLYGHVNYAFGPPRPVSGVEVGLDQNFAVVTDADGYYEFSNPSSGAHSLILEKDGDQRNAIDDTDTRLLLDYLAFKGLLSDPQMKMTDVSQDEEVSGADAIALMRYLNSMPGYTAHTGEWRFDPSPLQFNLVIEKMADFNGYILGDVIGNWDLPPKSRFKPENSGTERSLARQYSVPVSGTSQPMATIALPPYLPFTFSPIFVPVKATTDSSIGLIQFVVEYDSTRLKFNNVHLSSALSGFNMSTISTLLPFLPQSTGANQNLLIQISGNGTHYLNGSELPICILEFEDKNENWQQIPLTFDRMPAHTFMASEKLTDIRGADLNFIDGVLGFHDKVSQKEEIDVPEKFALHQNYPNPFNSETTIAFDVKEKSLVTLTVYDLLGRKIAVLINSEYKPGYHHITFNAADFSSGIYFYKIQMGEYSAIKKMVVVE
jgi:M6 family metalloprotease-like protein